MKSRKNGGFTLVEMMIVVAIFALVGMIVVDTSSNAKKRAEQKRQEEINRSALEVYDPTSVTTVENCSYIIINLNGTPQENAWLILKVIANFERAHPELKTIGTPVTDAQQSAYNTRPFVYGVWVYHEPKNIRLER